MKQTRLLTQLLLLGLVLAAAYFGLIGDPAPTIATPANDAAARSVPGTETPTQGVRLLQQAFEKRQGNLQVQVEAQVTRLLADDLDGSRHQRFIVRLASGQTLLVAHNIDLAPRVDGLATGDRVELYGEYEWNERGGVIHWTHRDPRGAHADGWIRHRGRLYQ